MKSFKEIVDYVVDNGNQSFYWHKNSGTSLSCRWWIDKDDITLAVDASLLVDIYEEVTIELVLYIDDKVEVVNHHNDHSKLVKEINDLELIP